MTMSALSEGAVRGVASLDLRRGPYPCSIWHERTVRKCDNPQRACKHAAGLYGLSMKVVRS